MAMFAGAFAITTLTCSSPAMGQMRGSARASAVEIPADEFLHTLTEEERAWLRQHPVIRVAQDPSWPPISFVDEDGVPSGMTNDYLQLIEQRLGLTFERVPNLSWQEAYARMERWEIDMTPSVAKTSERTAFWAFTKTYMSIPIVIVSPADVIYIGDPGELEGNRVAVVAGHVAETWLTRDFPKIQLVGVTTTEECLATVQRGDVSACVGNMLVVGYYLSMLKMTDLTITGSTNYINAQRMAVRKDWATLAVILDKALDSISATERAAIYRRWLPDRYEYGFDYTRLWQLAVVFALVLIGLSAWNARLAREIGQRKRAEATTAQTLRRLTEAQRIGQIGDWEHDLATDKVSWSPQVFEVLGRDPNLGPPRDLEETAAMYDAASRTLLEEKVARAIASGEPQDYELLALRPDGGRIHVQARAVARKDESGSVVGLYGTVQDVSERKLAEAAVRESEKKFSAVLGHMSEGVILVDADRNAIYQNPASLRILGFEPSDDGRIRNQDLPDSWKCWDEQGRPLHVDEWPISRVARGERVQNQVLRVRRVKTGHEFFGSFNGSPIYDDIGRFVLSFITVRDITERKQAEKVLRESERRFSGLLSNVELAAVMLDRNGLITYCNDYLLRLCGWRIEEVLGQDWFVLFAPPVLGNVKTTFAAQLEGLPAAREAENEILTKAGERRLIRWSNSTLRSVTGAVTGTASIGEDITQQRLSEVRINRLHRVSEMLTAINSLIVRVNDRDELFRGACDIAVKQGHFRMAWIGMVDKSGQLIVPVAAEGADPDFLALVEGRTSVLEAIPLSGMGMTARAVQERRAIVSNDIVGDTTMVLSKARLDRGIVSMAILPLLVSGSAVGVFALYAAESAFFDAEEMALLTQLAGDISFGVDHIEKQERIDYLAYYDVLTGLANRRLFLERVGNYTRSAAGGNHLLALCIFDLERFKSVNDSFGRSTGDELLRQVATWLTLNVTDASLLARVDADHFAVVMPNIANESDAARLAESSLAALVEHTFQVNDVALRVAAKVGVALFPDDGADADTLFTNAEIALRRAKTSGNRYMMFTPKMTEAVAGRLVLETQLRDALRNEEFVLHYQPKVSLATGRMAGAEALLRWNNPRTGLVAPGGFIPVLEETGLIGEVGTWVMRQALEDHRRWSAMGLDPGRIAVNISALQMRQRGFVELIKQMIGTERQYAAALELELTESLFMDDISVSIEQLRAIRELGVTIAIDDFGTGFSALSYLTRLPIDTIKIDGSFVRDMTSGPSGLALVSTIIGLGHALKLNVVGEAVETEEQSRLLHLLRCDEMQGYFYSRPLAAGQFEAHLMTHAARTT